MDALKQSNISEGLLCPCPSVSWVCCWSSPCHRPHEVVGELQEDLLPELVGDLYPARHMVLDHVPLAPVAIAQGGDGGDLLPLVRPGRTKCNQALVAILLCGWSGATMKQPKTVCENPPQLLRKDCMSFPNDKDKE